MFFRIKNPKKHKLILDIGSSQINGAVVLVNPPKKPDIKRKFQSENIILPETDLHRLWRKMSELLNVLVLSYRENANTVDEVLAVFSSPWYYSEIRQFFKKFDSPQAITKDYLAQIIEAEEKKFKTERELAFTHSWIISAKLNGYPLKNPASNIVGKTVREIYLSIYLSAFFDEAAFYLQKIFEDIGVKKIEFQNSPGVLFDVLSGWGYDNATVIDIGGEITDVTLVRDGEVRKVASFGRGLNYLVRRVAAATHFGLDEAASLILAYRDGRLDFQMREKVGRILETAVKEWAKLFQEALEKHMLPDLMPERMILVDGPGLVEFEEALESPSFNLYTAGGRPFLPPEKKINLMDFYMEYAA